MRDITNINSPTTLNRCLSQLHKQHQVLPPNAATLSGCRQRHDLPFAPAHNALDDAMATLELLFAQLSQLDPAGQCSIDKFVHTGGVKVCLPEPADAEG